MTPLLARVLKHELAHSFIASLTYGRCPGWLNEGVAQLVEPRDLAGEGAALAGLFRAGRAIPLSAMAGSFGGFDAVVAHVAYAESLATVEYIRDRYRMDGVQQMLKQIAGGASGEAALKVLSGEGYSGFEKRVGEYLAQKYAR
jgi:hypothetical protein